MPALYPYSYGKTLLKIENVCLNYGEHVILRNINAEIKDIVRPQHVQGQVVGIVGPSGIGKTQLFRIISGLNKPTSGSVKLNGSNRSVAAGEVGVVFQNYPLLEHRTVFSNLMLAASKKHDDKEANLKVMELLNLFELLRQKDLYPIQLSGGQRQRVSIAQQILCSNHFILMDEPFSGLDIVMEDKTLQFLQQVADMDDLNTLIITTHDISAAVSICDHIWMLGRDKDDKGNIVPGAYIKKVYDLIEGGLCWDQWQPNSQLKPAVAECIREIKQDFLML